MSKKTVEVDTQKLLTPGRMALPKNNLLDVMAKPTNKQLKERELLLLMRKIKPLLTESVMQTAKILRDPDSAESSKLKAAALLIETYRKLTIDLYDGNPEEEAKEVQPINAPVFSLRVIDQEPVEDSNG